MYPLIVQSFESRYLTPRHVKIEKPPTAFQDPHSFGCRTVSAFPMLNWLGIRSFQDVEFLLFRCWCSFYVPPALGTAVATTSSRTPDDENNKLFTLCTTSLEFTIVKYFRTCQVSFRIQQFHAVAVDCNLIPAANELNRTVLRKQCRLAASSWSATNSITLFVASYQQNFLQLLLDSAS